MTQMLSYRTVLLAKTGICSQDSFDGIQEYTTSVIGFINKCIDDVVPTVPVRTYHNQKPWITGSIRTKLKARAAAFKERDSNPEAYKKSAMPSDKPSNRQSINTGLRSNRTTSARMLVGCGRPGKPLRTTKGSTAESCPVTRAYQTSSTTSMLVWQLPGMATALPPTARHYRR